MTNLDWDDQNAYPLDASGTGTTFLMPQALIDVDATEHRDHPRGRRRSRRHAGPPRRHRYEDDGATFPYDAEVPGGTTDYTQFIEGAEAAGATGAMLALGEQEAVQVVRAGEQLDTDLVLGGSLGDVLARSDDRHG